ncbi:hypothetical protein BDW59DRAFT_163679 [Aspergillus cavernicola]|uniref:Uncharacterized protein n=1 Tax=Aspergillus cavernicola TaxID=176166 RepID=A0ABR4I4M7_9EURO
MALEGGLVTVPLLALDTAPRVSICECMAIVIYPEPDAHELCVGIDLTMAYGAVAIHFKNGTTKELGQIDGSSEYLATMRSLAEGAKIFHNPNPLTEQQLQLHESARTFYPSPFIRDWWWSLKAWNNRILEQIGLSAHPADEANAPNPYTPDKWIDVVADMLLNTKSTIIDTVDPPLKYNNVLAGLGHLDGYIVSYNSLQYDGKEVEFNEWGEEGYTPSGPYAMLVVSYNAASLGITLNTRQLGTPWPERLVESPQHGANQRNGSEEYWDEVKELLEDVIWDEAVDHVLLLGSHAYDTDLIRAIQGIVEGHTNINSSILDRYSSSGSDTLRDGNLPLFTAARQAAEIARKYGDRVP